MICVTAGTGDYRAIIEAQRLRCARYGYVHRIYDLGGLNLGTPYQTRPGDLTPTVGGDSLPPATFKAALVSKAMMEANPGELVCWLDGDCLPLREFEPEIGSCDVAVTLRPIPEIGLSRIPALDYLNSGAVWIRNSVHGRAFLEAWGRLSLLMGTDQGALNECIGLPHKTDSWILAMGNSRALPTGGRAMILDCTEWNCWHPPFKGARIAHFKRGLREQAVNYL